MEPILALESVGKSFRGRVVLLAASMWGRPGCITALLGRNGSGKSTLLRIGAGWLAADHGMVRFRSQLLQRPRLHRMSPAGLM